MRALRSGTWDSAFVPVADDRPPRGAGLVPFALDFLFDAHRYKVIYGGRGSAKSWSVARALLLRGRKRGGFSALVIHILAAAQRHRSRPVRYSALFAQPGIVAPH
jgi:hypothetical protein